MSLLRRTLRRLGEVASRFVGQEEERADDAETPDAKNSASDTGERLPDRLGELLPGSVADVREAAEKRGESVEEVRELTKAWIAEGEERARDLARHASDRIRSVWEPEDRDRILEESRLFDPLPVEAERAEPELLSLRWRNEALLALSSAGVLSLEDEIIQHTDRLFHAGAPTPELSERLFRQDYSELHRWIDTVPGSGVPGGGITHRMEHGHDLEAAAISQSERPGVSVGERDLEWRPRPLSAAANYLLAARAVLPSRSQTPPSGSSGSGGTPSSCCVGPRWTRGRQTWRRSPPAGRRRWPMTSDSLRRNQGFGNERLVLGA